MGLNIMVNAVDATAMAIFMFEGAAAHNPGTRNIRNNNPGNLRPYKPDQTTDTDGYRTFPNFSEGWAALLCDIKAKITIHLKPKQTMVDFFNIYAPGADHNDPHGYAQFVCKWMSDALDRTIALDSKIGDIYD